MTITSALVTLLAQLRRFVRKGDATQAHVRAVLHVLCMACWSSRCSSPCTGLLLMMPKCLQCRIVAAALQRWALAVTCRQVLCVQTSRGAHDRFFATDSLACVCPVCTAGQICQRPPS